MSKTYQEFTIEDRILRSYGKGSTDERCSRGVLSGKEYRGVGAWPGPERGDVWLDLGANIGAATIWFLDKGAKFVLAVEPGKDNALSWRYNLRASIKVGKVELVQAAVVESSCERKEVPLYLGQKKSVTHQVRDVPVRGRESIQVSTVTMDTLLDRRKDINAVKMDIEGMEVSVISELSLNRWKKIDKLCIEYHFGINPMMKDYWSVIALLEKAFKHVRLSSSLPREIAAKNETKWSVYPNTRIIYCWK